MAASDDGLQRLARLAASLPVMALAAMERSMQVGRDLCKETTAFQDQTGNLRKSIDAGIVESTQTSVTGALSAGYPEHGETEIYAGLVELGHEGPARAGPHPYIAPTMLAIVNDGILANELLHQFEGELR